MKIRNGSLVTKLNKFMLRTKITKMIKNEI